MRPCSELPSRLLGLALFLAAAGCSSANDVATTPDFATADLAGSWHYEVVLAGSTVSAGTAVGWVRGTLSIDAAGATSILTYEDSAGSTAVPALPPISFSLSGGGIVTATTTLFSEVHGRMNRTKTLFVTTATQGAGATARVRLSFYQRVVPGVTYGPEDAASTTLSLQQLGTGAAAGWTRAEITVDADRVHSLTQVVTDAGPGADVPAQGTLHVSPDGIVTTTANPTFKGFLSADKQVVVATENRSGAGHALSVLVRRGAVFAATDAAGTWDYSNLASLAGLGAWGHGAVTISETGAATFGPQVDSLGNSSTPSPETFSLAADGTLSHVPLDEFRGTLAPAKDLLVGTDTFGAGVYGMIVALR